MKLLKPVWVNHDDKPIFSVDLHPDCEKFATGGQGLDSGRVVIWNLLPVLSEEAACDENIPKMLCQMDNHLACVNCVRWSENGHMLASGSDDKLVMIWTKAKGPSGIFGNGGIQKTPESWKCAFTLRGHAGDVLDLAWSPQDRWLASCSVDNTIIVWDVHAFPAMVTCLRGHSGLVKGVTWDPVGKYLASQSDDRSVKLWRTSDWSCSKTITEPFEECGGTTHILRLSWSPDGQYLVSAHAMNGGGPTAQIIEREGWKCDKDFVGHRKAVTCVRFYSSILKRQVSKNNKPQQYCCLAVGSRDRSVSVWMTALQRPLVVVHELFNDSVLDLSWGPARCVLIACSGDGTVACLQFSEDDVGTPLAEDEKNSLYQRIYGKSINNSNGTNGSSDFVIENPELLNISPDKIKPPSLPAMPIMTNNVNNTFNINNNNTNNINNNNNINIVEKSSAMFSSSLAPSTPAAALPPIIESSSSVVSETVINSTTATSNTTISLHSNVFKQSMTSSTSSSASVPAAISSSQNTAVYPIVPPTQPAPTSSVASSRQREFRTADGKRRITPLFIPLDQDATITSNSSHSAAKRAALEEPSDIQVLPTNASAPNLPTNAIKGPPLNAAATGQPNTDTEDPNLDQRLLKKITSSPSAFTTHQVNGSTNGVAIPLPTDQQQQQQQKSSSANRAFKPSGTLWSASTAGPKITITPTTRVEFQKTAINHRVHVHNGHTDTATGLLAKVTAFTLSDIYIKQWDAFIGSPIVNLNFNCNYLMICCLDGTLRLVDLKTGVPALPILTMTSTSIQCAFCSAGRLVGVITDCGILRIWNLKDKTIHLNTNCRELFKNGTIATFMITEAGLPIVIFANGQSFSYSKDLETWIVLNSFDPIVRHGLHTTHTKKIQKNYVHYPVTSAQTSIDNFTALGNVTDLNINNWQSAAKISFAENQVKLSEYMQSPIELKHWYNMLAFYLATHGTEERMRLMLDHLIGNSDDEDDQILSVPKHELFEQALDVIRPHVKWQRLYMEYKELYGYNKYPDRMNIEDVYAKAPSPVPLKESANPKSRPSSRPQSRPEPQANESPQLVQAAFEPLKTIETTNTTTTTAVEAENTHESQKQLEQQQQQQQPHEKHKPDEEVVQVLEEEPPQANEVVEAEQAVPTPMEASPVEKVESPNPQPAEAYSRISSAAPSPTTRTTTPTTASTPSLPENNEQFEAISEDDLVFVEGDMNGNTTDCLPRPEESQEGSSKSPKQTSSLASISPIPMPDSKTPSPLSCQNSPQRCNLEEQEPEQAPQPDNEDAPEAAHEVKQDETSLGEPMDTTPIVID